MGGFRIEVTVQAKSLSEARTKVDRLPFWDINFWRDPRGHGTERYKVDIKLVSKEGLLDNANWILQKAEDRGVFSGRNDDKPSKVQLQAMADVLCGLGWNAGKKRTTLSLSLDAWWWGESRTALGRRTALDDEGTRDRRTQQVDMPGEVTSVEVILKHLNLSFAGKEGKKELVKILRSGTETGCLPCKKDNGGGGRHNLTFCGWKPFRMRCGDKSCRSSMLEGETMRWFAELVDRGHVDRTAVGMSNQGVSPVPVDID